jgi:hypothetical protein
MTVLLIAIAVFLALVRALRRHDRTVDVAIANVWACLQQFGHRLQERIPVSHGERLGRAEDGTELDIGKSKRRHAAQPRRVLPGIRDLASLSKTLARNRKSCTGVAATKGTSPWLRA